MFLIGSGLFSSSPRMERSNVGDFFWRRVHLTMALPASVPPRFFFCTSYAASLGLLPCLTWVVTPVSSVLDHLTLRGYVFSPVLEHLALRPHTGALDITPHRSGLPWVVALFFSVLKHFATLPRA